MTRDIDYQSWESELFIVQGGSRRELIAEGKELLAFLDGSGESDPADLAFSLNCPLKEDAPFTLSIVAAEGEELKRKLSFSLDRLADESTKTIKDRSGIFFFEEQIAREGELAFVFPGEGSQYPGMMGDLCRHFPVVRNYFDLSDRVFRETGRSPLPSEVVFPPPMPGGKVEALLEKSLWEMDYAVNLVFCAVNAMRDILKNLGITPWGVVGHSSGEFSALIASGALAVRDMDQLAEYELALTRFSDDSIDALLPRTRFLTVGGANPELISECIAESGGALTIAMDNCPNQAIICGGDSDRVEEARKSLQKKGAICSYLPFERGYHTESFRPVCEKYLEFFRGFEIVSPPGRIYSCATTKPYPSDPEDVRQLCVDQWASPVLFRETIEAMYEAGARIFLEVGPRDNLNGFLNDILAKRRYLALPTNVPFRAGTTQLNHSLGLLAASGVPMKLDYLYERRASRGVYRGGGGEAEGKKKGLPPMTLPLHIPKLRVEPGFTPPAPRRAAPEPAVVPEPVAAPEPVTAPEPVAAPEPVTPGPGALSAPPSRAERSPRFRMMQGHMETMESFLAAQEGIMAAFSTRRAGGRGFARPAAGAPAKGGRPVDLPCAPFRVTLLSHEPGRRLTARCRLDLDEDLYIWDHTLGSDISAYDRTLQGLPVVPLTMSAEIMTQAAALLCPGRTVIGMRDVRTYQWVEVYEGAATDILISAVQREGGSGDEVEVRILKPDADVDAPPSMSSTYNEGTVLFADGYPAPPPLAVAPLEAPEPFRVNPEDYYREIMFHGPAFAGIRSIDMIGGNGLDATITNPRGVPLFASDGQPDFLTDPVLLDVAGQLVGFWMFVRLEKGFVGFPIGFYGLRIYAPLPKTEEPLSCYTRITEAGEAGSYRGDITVTDSSGRLLFVIEGWGDLRAFEWSREFVTFFHHPGRTSFTEPWPAPTAGMPGIFGRRCLESGAEFWKKVAACIVLNRPEREEFFGIRGIEKRRREWLTGRIAAKDAVRACLKEKYGVDAFPADIEITPDAFNRPVVGGRLLADLGCRVNVSISHLEQGAAALACDGAAFAGVGLDVESMLPEHEGIETAAFTEAERALFPELGTPTGKEWLLRFWCAKEALAKALGRGLQGTPLNLTVVTADRLSGRVALRIVGELARQLPEFSDKTFSVQTGRDEDLVFAVALV